MADPIDFEISLLQQSIAELQQQNRSLEFEILENKSKNDAFVQKLSHLWQILADKIVSLVDLFNKISRSHTNSSVHSDVLRNAAETASLLENCYHSFSVEYRDTVELLREFKRDLTVLPVDKVSLGAFKKEHAEKLSSVDEFFSRLTKLSHLVFRSLHLYAVVIFGERNRFLELSSIISSQIILPFQERFLPCPSSKAIESESPKSLFDDYQELCDILSLKIYPLLAALPVQTELETIDLVGLCLIFICRKQRSFSTRWIFSCKICSIQLTAEYPIFENKSFNTSRPGEEVWRNG